MVTSADDLEWQLQARCRGFNPELFFPDRVADAAKPKLICRDCLVKLDCLVYAYVNDEQFGIWGGMSARERRHHFGRRAAL